MRVISKKRCQRHRDRARVTKAVEVLQCLEHDNVCKVVALSESSKHVYIFLEHAPHGNVLEVLRRHGRMEESRARCVCEG